MFKFINYLFPDVIQPKRVIGKGESDMKAFTKTLNDGRTGLFKTNGELVSSFARPRDANRGAARRGLTLIN